MSMARLWRDRGRRDDARDLLCRSTLGSRKGSTRLILQDARTLLGELGWVQRPEAKMLQPPRLLYMPDCKGSFTVRSR